MSVLAVLRFTIVALFTVAGDFTAGLEVSVLSHDGLLPLNHGLATAALQPVGGVRLKRVLAATWALVTLGHHLSLQ